MAVVGVTAQNTRLDDAETATQWGAIGGGAGGALETDFSYQGSSCWARKGATSQRGIFLSDDVNTDISPTGTYQTVMIKYICTTPGLLDLISVPGLALELGSGATVTTPSSNFYSYNVQGSDTYPIDKSWLVIPINPNIAAHRSGTTGSPNLVLFNGVALQYDQTGTSKSPNNGLDAVDVGSGLTLTGGDGADADGNWESFAAFDWGTQGNRFGYVRKNESVYLIYGMMVIGSATDTVFTDSNKTVVYPDGLFAAGFSGYTINLSTGNVFTESNITHIGIGTITGEDTRPVLICTGAGGTASLTGNTYNKFSKIDLITGATLEGCSFVSSGEITVNGAYLEGCLIDKSTSASSVVDSTLENLFDCRFVSDGSNHAVRLTSIGIGTMSWSNTLVGYSGSNGSSGNEAIWVDVPTGVLTINVSDGYTSPSIRTSGATVIVNAGLKTVKFTILDEDTNAPIEFARIEVNKDSDKSNLYQLETNASGVASTNVVYTGDVPVVGWARQWDLAGDDFTPKDFSGTISSSGLDLIIKLKKIST